MIKYKYGKLQFYKSGESGDIGIPAASNIPFSWSCPVLRHFSRLRGINFETWINSEINFAIHPSINPSIQHI